MECKSIMWSWMGGRCTWLGLGVPIVALSQKRIGSPISSSRKGTIVFADDEIDETNTQWGFSLVARPSSKSPVPLTKVLQTKWQMQDNLEIIPIADRNHVIKLNNDEDRSRIMSDGNLIQIGGLLGDRFFSYTMFNLHFLLSCGSSFDPVSCWGRNMILRIAKGAGRPLRVDSVTSDGKELNYARVCVVVDASKPEQEQEMKLEY